MRQIGFAVNEANKTLLRQAVRTENAKEKRQTKKQQVDQNCNYFLILKNETDTCGMYTDWHCYMWTLKNLEHLSLTFEFNIYLLLVLLKKLCIFTKQG